MRHIQIGLLWHSVNSPNLGLGALTLGQLAILDELCADMGIRPGYYVIGAGDREPAYVVRPDLRVKGLRTKDYVKPVGGMIGALRACDVIIDIGGGDSFADIYGGQRFRRLAATKIAGLLFGRPLVLAPQTIGPFDKPWARRVARWIMNRARLVVTRDRLSSAYLDEIGFDGTRLEATDVAFRLPYSAPAPRTDGPVKVGLNVSGLLYNGGYTRSNMFGLATDYPTLIDSIVARLMARGDIELHLVGHVLAAHNEVEDDYRVAERIAAGTPGAVLAPRFADPSEAKSYIAGMDFFAGARMHACIAAYSAGVAVLPMAYSRKFVGLFGTLGYDLVADCRSEDAAAIETKFFESLDGRAALAERARQGAADGQARLQRYADALRPLLDERAR